MVASYQVTRDAKAIVADLIIAKTNEAQLKSIVERLPLHDNQIGKLAITKQYGLLAKGQLRFIRCASELRNELVHRLENIDFRFEQYVASMDGNQRKAWCESLTWHSLGTEASEAWAKAAVENTKVAFWFSVFMLVTIVVFDSETLKMQNEQHESCFRRMRSPTHHPHNMSLEWTGHQVLSASPPQAPCLPFKGGVIRIPDGSTKDLLDTRGCQPRGISRD